jgi:predicted  nucleic acid-binding Zn-ribbon protein
MPPPSFLSTEGYAMKGISDADRIRHLEQEVEWTKDEIWKLKDLLAKTRVRAEAAEAVLLDAALAEDPVL